jgi:Transposase DDE domain group 1
MAYVPICALRRIGLTKTVFANATCGTIRLKLLKIGALIRISVRRVRIAMTSACPAADDRLAPPADWPTPPRPAPRPSETRRRNAPIARHHPLAHGDPKNIRPLAAHSAPPSRLPIVCGPENYQGTSQKRLVV